MLKMLNQTANALVAIAALLAACAFIVSCSSEAQTNPCPDGTEPYTEYRLFFGRGDDSAQVVSDDAWGEFLEDTITVQFPAGLTVLDARGQYTDSAETLIREDTKVLIILVSPNSGSAPKIDTIIDEYKQRFTQQAVLRQVIDTCASF